jgi:transporter family-2 protein
MGAFLFPLIVVAGVLQALGNSMNAQLNHSLRNPWLAGLVSFLLITAFFSVRLPFRPAPSPRPETWPRCLGGRPSGDSRVPSPF